MKKKIEISCSNEYDIEFGDGILEYEMMTADCWNHEGLEVESCIGRFDLKEQELKIELNNGHLIEFGNINGKYRLTIEDENGETVKSFKTDDINEISVDGYDSLVIGILTKYLEITGKIII
jgi:hypothetical protein